MKILVLSDSHGAVSPMEQAVEQTSPDLILHLGDCWRDGNGSRQVSLHPPGTGSGNCDFRPTEPAERLLELRGKRILLCHGHTYGVKQSLVTAGFAAEENSWTSSSSATPTDPWWTGGAGHCS
ncbi:MAG: metallophosphoesterase family protein [Dysosmobacter welbionis]